MTEADAWTIEAAIAARTTTVRAIRSFGAVLALALFGACQPMDSHDEVSRVAAPGGAPLDAVLVEFNPGATDTFQYQVFVLPHGGRPAGEPVLSLVGATRNAHAFGANLRWQGPADLRVEYFKAHEVRRGSSTVTVQGQTVRVRPVADVLDAGAPVGGMAYNLRQAEAVVR